MLGLAPKQLEMHGHVFTTVAADVLVLKHHTNSIHSADKSFTVSEQFHTKIL